MDTSADDTYQAGESKTADSNGLPSENGTENLWSGRRESNPRLNLGKVAFYH
jgi:hypothetical protein